MAGINHNACNPTSFPCSPRSPACFCSLKVKPVTYLHSHSRNQQSTYEKVNVFHKALFELEPSPSPFRRFALWFRFLCRYSEIKTTARPRHAVTKWKWRLLDIPTFKVTKTVLLKEGAKLYKMSKDLRAVTMGLSTVAVLLCRNRVVGKSWVRHRCRPPAICERGRRHSSLAVSTYAQRNGGKAAPLTSSFHVAHTET